MRAWGLAMMASLAVSCGGSGSWYQLAPDSDFSYLPMGDAPHALVTIQAGDDAVDVYYPTDRRAGVVVFLPGAAIVKERYAWIGQALASHGVAVAIAQPPGAFATSHQTTATLAALAADDADTTSPLAGHIDTTRVILSGHSAGTIVQAGLTFLPGCPQGFCDSDAARPAGLRGLALLAFHDQDDPATATAPMPAAEVPWLMLTGSRDGLTTPDKAHATFARLQDRPVELVQVTGMNHYQFTEWIDPAHDVSLQQDLTPTIANRTARAIAAQYLVAFAGRVLDGDATVAADLGAAADKRVMATFSPEKVPAPPSTLPRLFPTPFGTAGLGDADNSEVVASAEYSAALYLLVRNDVTGAQLWRIRAGAPEQVAWPTNARLNCVLGALTVWNDQLWIGLSSGVQGASRGSTGGEVWRYDGTTFTPVVSTAAHANDRQLTLTAVTGCGQPTATLTVANGGFTPHTLSGATLDDAATEAAPAVTVLEVLDNDATTLTVRSGELATGTDTVGCDHVAAGAQLALHQGATESGFGQPWNKAITAIEPYGDALYVATGLNLRDGGEVWSTTDGASFSVAVPRSFFGTHADGTPLSSSVTALHASPVDVAGGPGPALYLGANGTSSYGDRLAVVDATGARFIIDGDAGPLQPGMHGSAQVADLFDFGGDVWLTTFNFAGLEMMSSSTPDVAWQTAIGVGGALAPGFGDPVQFYGRAFVIGGQLWVATVADTLTHDDLEQSSGQAWRSVDGHAWQRVTAHAFGINSVDVSRIFAFEGVTYAAVGNGALAARGALGSLQLYQLTEQPF